MIIEFTVDLTMCPTIRQQWTLQKDGVICWKLRHRTNWLPLGRQHLANLGCYPSGWIVYFELMVNRTNITNFIGCMNLIDSTESLWTISRCSRTHRFRSIVEEIWRATLNYMWWPTIKKLHSVPGLCWFYYSMESCFYQEIFHEFYKIGSETATWTFRDSHATGKKNHKKRKLNFFFFWVDWSWLLKRRGRTMHTTQRHLLYYYFEG